MKKLSHMLPLFLLCGLLLFASGCGRNKNNDNGSNNGTVTQQTEENKVTDRVESDTVTDQPDLITDQKDPVSDNDPDHLNNSVTSGISDNGMTGNDNNGISDNNLTEDDNMIGDIANDIGSTAGNLLHDAQKTVNDVMDGTGDVVSDVTGRR